jgi:hypothetical protein
MDILFVTITFWKPYFCTRKKSKQLNNNNMKNNYNQSQQHPSSIYPAKSRMDKILGFNYLNDFYKSPKSVKNNEIKDREELFRELFGAPYHDDEQELKNIIRNKLATINDQEKSKITGKLNQKVSEMEAKLALKKSRTMKHFVISVTLLTVGILSTWYLFENDVIINMKLMLCQTAIIGFIAGFKELHVLIMGESEYRKG